MQQKILKDVIIDIAGPNASKLIDLLYGRENVNEFDIAKKLGVTINQARNILYRLSDQGLVNFIRKKDKKNGGWYTYFWTLNIRRSLDFLHAKIRKDIEELEAQKKMRQQKQFYFCSNCHMELSEENALTHDFTCPECGEVFKLKDNASEMLRLDSEINKLKDSLNFVNSELLEIQKKREAGVKRKLKAEDKKKKAVRRARSEERARLAKKEMKKGSKKTQAKSKAKKISTSKKIRKK